MYSINHPTSASASSAPLRCAVLDTASLSISAHSVCQCLQDRLIPHTRLRVSDITSGRLLLPRFNVLLVPGGDPQPALDALGAAGRASIHAFVSSGGGFVGICAGANVAVELGLVRLQRRGSNWYHHYNPSATLLLNTAHLAVPPAAHTAWQEVFGAPAPVLPVPVSFMHSPLLFPTDTAPLMCRVTAQLPEHSVHAEAGASTAVEILAVYADDLWADDSVACHVDAVAAKLRSAGVSAGEATVFAARQRALDGAVAGAAHPPPGLMTSAAAVCRSTFGAGRVLLFSPHPEVSCGGSNANQELVRRAAAWAAAGGGAATDPAGAQSAPEPDAAQPILFASATNSDFPRPCEHAVAALDIASTRNEGEAGCATLASGTLCGAAAAAEAAEAEERPAFACVRHLRLGAYRRCAAPGCASNTRGVYLCLMCGVVMCGRGTDTHMGQHMTSAHGRGGGLQGAGVCVYFGIPMGFNGQGLMGGRGGEKGKHAWCYTCDAACAVE